MGHRAVVARYTARGSQLVVPEAFASRLAAGPWDEPPAMGAPDDPSARSVRVCQLLAGAPVSRLSAELARDGLDVVVLLLVDEPADLPVGPLLHEILRHGHRVVEATPVTSRIARSVLVVTRDPDVPMAAYLSGEPLDHRAAERRALAEHVVEGMVTRAQRTRVSAQLEALRQEVDGLRAAETAALEAQRAHRRRAEELERKLADLERRSVAHRAQDVSRLVGRAVREIRADPLRGPGVVSRAAIHKARRGG